VIDRSTDAVTNQIALTDIGDVTRFLVFGEQMIERLIARRAHVLRDCLIPFLTVRKNRIDVEHHTAKIEQTVTHDFANAETALGLARSVDVASRLTRKEM